MLFGGFVFRNEPQHRCREPEGGDGRQDQHPGPDDDEDAVIELAEPAGEDNLGRIGEDRANNANGEGLDRDLLCAGPVVGTRQGRVRLPQIRFGQAEQPRRQDPFRHQCW